MDKRLINWLNESVNSQLVENAWDDAKQKTQQAAQAVSDKATEVKSNIQDLQYANQMAKLYKRNPKAEAELEKATQYAINQRYANNERSLATKFLQERDNINKTISQNEAQVCTRFLVDYFQSQGNLRNARINQVAPFDVLAPALKQPKFSDQTYEEDGIIKELLSCLISYPTEDVAQEMLLYMNNNISDAFDNFISQYKPVNKETSHIAVYIPENSKKSVLIDMYLEKYKQQDVEGQTEPNNEWQERVIDEYTDKQVDDKNETIKDATYRYQLKRRPGVHRGFYIYDDINHKVLETNLPVVDELHAIKYFQDWCEANLRVTTTTSLPTGEFILVKIPYTEPVGGKKTFRYAILDKEHQYYSYEIDTQDPNVATQEFELWMNTNRVIDKSPDGKYLLVRQKGLDNKFRIVYQINGEYRNKNADINATKIPEAKKEFLQWCQTNKLKDALNFDNQGGHRNKRRGPRR